MMVSDSTSASWVDAGLAEIGSVCDAELAEIGSVAGLAAVELIQKQSNRIV